MAARVVAWILPRDAPGLSALPVVGSISRRGYRPVFGKATQPRVPLRPSVFLIVLAAQWLYQKWSGDVGEGIGTVIRLFIIASSVPTFSLGCVGQ